MRKSPEAKLVGIICNPNAVLNSWMKNPKKFPPGSEPLKEWRFGDCKYHGHEYLFGNDKWKAVASLYLDLHAKWPDRVYVLRCETLVCLPVEIVRNVFAFFRLELYRTNRVFSVCKLDFPHRFTLVPYLKIIGCLSNGSANWIVISRMKLPMIWRVHGWNNLFCKVTSEKARQKTFK